MLIRLALRSLTTRPLRSAVLAAGFGLGIGVMVELLGVGEVILEQAQAPALRGGGDVVITGVIGPLESARFVLDEVLTSRQFRSQVRVASPTRHATLYMVSGGKTIPVAVRAGIPSREQAIGDPEVQTLAWRDTPADRAWIAPAPGEVLRSMDRFHPVPASHESPEARPRGWAEWLYFNGRSRDGRLRFYLSFIAGDVDAKGRRPMGVRLQLDRNGRITSYAAGGQVDDRDLIARAPDLDMGGNRVRLVGTQYRIALALEAGPRGAALRESGGADRRPGRKERALHGSAGNDRRPGPSGTGSDGVTGELTLDAAPGRSLPPAEIRGAHGWLSGYVVPVLAGTFHGRLTIDGETISLDDLAGYHDHNWGYWEGVRWQWGQVASGDLSIVYGRVFPPADVANASRIPGFLGLLGPAGPIAFSTNVTIRERGTAGVPDGLDVQASGDRLSLRLSFDVAESERTSSFLQLGGVYRVTGTARDRDVNFTARGSAETFRPAESGTPDP